MIDRNYILNLIKSKDVTIDQFNYDKMVAPPIHYYFNDLDLNRLYQIATSLRYSAKPREKYREIDNIMHSRGFTKIGSGTNRLVYGCIENDTFVAKVPYCERGLNDNPREFINQNYLKPFCAKTFEVSSNGILVFQERVNPITNREEFLSIAEDVFTLITEYIVGEGVMDDIGTKFFMNYGLRRGFGPVILDYSTYYVLDGNKLYCMKEDLSRPEKKCLGEIDYDAGYNKLVCKRCGREYFAHELELKIANKMIITSNNKGEHKMKVTISGGSKGNSRVTTTINDVEKKQAVWTTTENNNFNNEIHVSLKDAMKKKDIIQEVKVNNNSKKKPFNDEPKTVNGVPEVKVESKKKEEPIVEKAEEKKVEEPPKNLKSPITIGSSEKKTPKEVFRDTIYEAAKNISDASLSNNVDKNYILNAVHHLSYLIDTMRSLSMWDHECEVMLHDIVIDDLHETIELKNEREGNKVIATSIIYSNVYDTQEEIRKMEAVYEDVVPEEEDKEYDNVEPAEEIESDEFYLPDDESESVVSTAEGNNIVEETIDVDVDDIEDEYDINDDDTETPLVGVATFVAKTIDITTKFPNSQSKNVIVIEDGNGELLTVGENMDHLLVIDRINGMDTSEIEVVSKSFVANILKEVDENATTELPTDNTNEVIVSSVNGVS